MTTDFSRSARVTIDLSALEHNLAVIRRYAGQAGIIAVVKSDAYGHGMLKVAGRLEGKVAGFAVACVNEALKLREGGVQSPVVVLQGFDSREALFHCIEQQLVPLVHCQQQIRLLESAVIPELSVWLKLDTGMGRLGFHYQHGHKVLQQLQQIKGVKVACLASHLSDADTPEAEKNRLQGQRFEQLVVTEKIAGSLLNSAGLLIPSLPRYQWVRPGIMLYGINPLAKDHDLKPDLQPVMSLHAPVIAVKTIYRGETVGYGSCWRATEDSRIALLAIGYGDGYPRSVVHAKVCFEQKLLPVIGRVSMDMLAVKIDNLQVNPGDEMLLWGEGLAVEKVAAKADTIPYELLCSVAKVKHKYIN